MSRFLVTGATGFLGRHLVRSLLDHGDEVVALVRKRDAELPSEVKQAIGDVLDRASLEKALGDGAYDGVFHAAGKVSRRAEDAEELHTLHVQGTKNVVDACIAKGVRRL